MYIIYKVPTLPSDIWNVCWCLTCPQIIGIGIWYGIKTNGVPYILYVMKFQVKYSVNSSSDWPRPWNCWPGLTHAACISAVFALQGLNHHFEGLPGTEGLFIRFSVVETSTLCLFGTKHNPSRKGVVALGCHAPTGSPWQIWEEVGGGWSLVAGGWRSIEQALVICVIFIFWLGISVGCPIRGWDGVYITSQRRSSCVVYLK